MAVDAHLTTAGPQRPNCAEAPVAVSPEPPRRGGRLLFSASLVSQGVALLRYLILARLLGPEQLGLAAALTVASAFFGMITDTGSDRFLIQDRYGEAIEVQKLVQLVYVSRGILVAAGLVIFANPMAYFYDSPRLVAGLTILAVQPLVLGFFHLDIRRMQRSHDFRSEAICLIAAEPAGLLAAVIFAWLTRDFKAVVYGLIACALVRVVSSHLLAKRPYRLGWAQEHASRLARFATPLMLNGVLLFIVSQSDRVIVGNHLGITALGYYSTIALLIYVPSNVVAGYMHAIFIPLIAARRDSRSEQDCLIDSLGGQTLLIALAMAAGFAIVAPWMVPTLFGARFAQPAMLIGLIGILQATRFLLGWPTATALALGRSTTVLASNLAHFLIFPGAFVGLRLIGGLSGVVVGFIGAEVVAVAVALVLLNRNLNRRSWHGFERLGALILFGSAIMGWNLALQLGLWSVEACMLLVSIPLTIWLYCREGAVIREVLGSLVKSFGVR
jgi:O-antigen/teichoic acid export membrane protein